MRGSVHTLPSNHIRYLDNRVNICLRKHTLSTSTLDIETEDSQGCNLLPLSFGGMWDEGIEP